MRALQHGVRRLLRTPTYTVTATLTLALGIGATTAIFSVVQTVLLRSLPYDQPERIVRAWDNTRDGDITEFSFRVVEYRELRTRTDVFEAVGAEFPVSATVLFEADEPRQVQGRMVTSDFFRVFGVAPALGRMFTAEEIAAGDRLICVVTHDFWSRHLGADPAALGRTVVVDGNPFTLVGVLPQGYRHVSGRDAQLFIPYTIGTSRWTAHWLDIYASLKPGVSLDRTAAEINDALRAVGDSDRASDRWYATVETLHEMVVGDVSAMIWAVFALVGLVLLLACVNVANLTLARSSSRLSEVSIRQSLGASRAWLAIEFLAEHAVLAAVGGTLGLGLAAVSLGSLLRLAPSSIPRIADTRLDGGVLAFSLAVSVVATLVFGLGPALRATRHDTAARALSPARGETGRRALHGLLGGLVVTEVALAFTLLVAAGLTVRTLEHLRRQQLGFDRASALTFRIAVPSSRYATGNDTYAFYTRLREALGALPGVTAVGATTDLPVSGEGAVATVTSEERVQSGVEEGVTVLQRRATAGLFSALGTPLVAGREFDSRDRRDGETVVIVSESLARSLFGGARAAIGRRIGWGSVPLEDDWVTVVGVVADIRYEDVERAPDPQIYQAHSQSTTREMALVVRTDREPLALVEPVMGVLQTLDSRIPIYSVGTLDGLVDAALAGRRFTMTLFGLFGLLALGLTVAGLYGMLAFVVAQRRREIGIRIAIGASGPDVLRMVVVRGVSLVALGLAFGAPGVYVSGRLLRALLFGVTPLDPATLAVVSTLLIGVAIAACIVPALGAARVDPVEVLRAG